MNWKKYLWTNKEGAIIGFLWGLMSTYTSLGLTNLPYLTIWQKTLILPVWIWTPLLKNVEITSPLIIALPLIAGTIIGIIIDTLYKPKE